MACEKPNHQYLEILDEEYQGYLELATELMKTLKRPKDRKICGKLIKRCQSLDAANLEVKLNRNEFFKYFLRTLKITAQTQPLQYDDWFKPRNPDDKKEESFWSPDKRTYVAIKALAGYGTLIYIAVADDPELGWQSCGFQSYDFEQ